MKKPKHLTPCDEDLELLSTIDYVVEADPYARMSLWLECRNMIGVTWEQLPGSVGTTVGLMKKMPIVVTLNPTKILGVNVIFWDACSTLTHVGIIRGWFKEVSLAYRRGQYCDAMNFSHCLNHIFSVTDREHKDYPRVWDVASRRYTREYTAYVKEQDNKGNKT